MAPARDVEAFVRRLEHRIAREVRGRHSVALAYSGGLASTLIAAIARKRTVLECVVAGVEGAPDLQAARTSRSYLDYRVEYVILSREDAIRIHEEIAAAHPKLRRGDVENLVPLHAVLERTDRRPMVSGFGSPQLSTSMIAALRRAHVLSPIHAAERGASVPRERLREAATMLGLPAAWARAPHRPAAEGAGLRAFLRSPDRDGG